MNLVLPQLWKDVRQFRVLLAIWLGLVLLDLAVNLGWAGQVVYTPRQGFERAANAWVSVLPGVIWALAGLLPSLVILTDSPARREGFLATRPMPKLDLFLAKVAFILVCVVAPWTLTEFVYLAAKGVPAWAVEQGTLERFMFTLPVAFGLAAYAALWPGLARWARAAAVTAVGGYLLIGIVIMVNFNLYRSNLSNPNLAQTMAGVYELTLALAVLAVWHARAHRGILSRGGGIFLAIASCGLTLVFWPWNLFALKPHDQAAANSTMAATDLSIPLRAVNLQKVEDAAAGSPYFNISLTPKTRPLPPGRMIDWSGTDARLVSSSGEIHGARGGHANLFTSHWWNDYYGVPDMVAWLAELPPDVLFRQNAYSGVHDFGFVGFNHFNVPAIRPELTEPVSLQAQFEARVFQWRKIADLPLTPGATAADEFGSWKFIARSDQAPNVQVFLERRQIELATAADSRCSSAESGALSRMAFMVYDPIRHVVWIPDQAYTASVTRSTHTALPEYFVQLYFNGRQAFTAQETVACRLVVFEKSWLGSVPETWQSPPFNIAEKLKPALVGFARNNDPMSRAEFDRRIAALKTPAPDAPRRDIGLYLLDYLRLVDARTFPLDVRDPHTRQLAAFVPAHLDMMLDGLSAMGQAAKMSVLNAIKIGATESQKPAIFAALSQTPELAGVLLARGWVDAARPEIYELAKSSRGLPMDAMRAIAWFQDPKTYPRLLEEFNVNPTVAGDDLLRTLPGLDAQVDEIVARKWQETSLVFRNNSGFLMFGDPFRLALRHGQTSALQRAFVLLADPEFDKLGIGFNLADSLREEIYIPDLAPEERQNPENILAWVRKHRPEDFVYNPSLRQFVLQPGMNRAQTASNP